MTALTLLQLNIEYGGTGVDFDEVVAVIASSGASVVALQEGCGNVPRLASALGWPWFDNRTQVVSRLPLLDPPERDAGVTYVETSPGEILALINVHPHSRGYGPKRLAQEARRRVLRRERNVRLAELRPSLAAASELMGSGVPVVLLGDFNAPSHRDWTPATVGLRPHVTEPVAWPTSVATEEAGLVDAYRAVHPDPVAWPGITWPANRPFVEGYNPAADGDPADRIDFMHVSPDIKVVSVQIVGEAASEFTELAHDPWPTDHRGLLADLEVPSVAPPGLVSVLPRVVAHGDHARVRATPAATASVVVVPRGAASDAVVHEVAPLESGAGELPTELVGAGVVDVVARDAERRELARTTLWVAGPEHLPTVIVAPEFVEGEPIGVRWEWAPGNRADWLAIYPRTADPASTKRLLRRVTHARVEGETVFDESARPGVWPLPAGEYRVHLLMDDLSVSLAHADFCVV